MCSEVTDITGIVNSLVKMFLGTKTWEDPAPPPKFLLAPLSSFILFKTVQSSNLRRSEGGLVCVENWFADVKALR